MNEKSEGTKSSRFGYLGVLGYLGIAIASLVVGWIGLRSAIAATGADASIRETLDIAFWVFLISAFALAWWAALSARTMRSIDALRQSQNGIFFKSARTPALTQVANRMRSSNTPAERLPDPVPYTFIVSFNSAGLQLLEAGDASKVIYHARWPRIASIEMGKVEELGRRNYGISVEILHEGGNLPIPLVAHGGKLFGTQGLGKQKTEDLLAAILSFAAEA